MILGLRPYSLLLALLLLGSASIQAQNSDPFPKVNFRRYQGNMTITAKVVKYGQPITDAVVAVYCDETIRGKESVGSGTNPNLAYLTVYGNKTGAKQELYFKIYTSGNTFTYNPSTAVTFKNNRSVGSNSEPYIIDVTPAGSVVSLADNADNTETLTTWNGKTCNIALTGRTLWKDGAWNTLCLPFDLTIAGSILDGDNVDVRTLSSTELSDGTLTLNFTVQGAVTKLEAGTPYIIKWSKDKDTDPDPENLVDPTFTDVTVNNTTNNITTQYANFIGTYSPEVFAAKEVHNDILFLGGSNNIGYPDGIDKTTIRSFSAYFQLNGITVCDPSNPTSGSIMRTVLNVGDGTLGVGDVPFTIGNENSIWYDLNGRRINGRPTAKGIYIVNNRKVILK